MIESLAEKLQRSQSDAVRFLVISAVRELDEQQRVSSQEKFNGEHVSVQ
jgi:hypothetical protein